MDKNKKDKFAREYKRAARNNKFIWGSDEKRYFRINKEIQNNCDCGITRRCFLHGY